MALQLGLLESGPATGRLEMGISTSQQEFLNHGDVPFRCRPHERSAPLGIHGVDLGIGGRQGAERVQMSGGGRIFTAVSLVPSRGPR
jgi:hypothetical protein